MSSNNPNTAAKILYRPMGLSWLRHRRTHCRGHFQTGLEAGHRISRTHRNRSRRSIRQGNLASSGDPGRDFLRGKTVIDRQGCSLIREMEPVNGLELTSRTTPSSTCVHGAAAFAGLHRADEWPGVGDDGIVRIVVTTWAEVIDFKRPCRAVEELAPPTHKADPPRSHRARRYPRRGRT